MFENLMNSSIGIKSSINCIIHPTLPILCYCSVCNIFKCVFCIRSNTEDHDSSYESDIVKVISEKLEKIRDGQAKIQEYKTHCFNKVQLLLALSGHLEAIKALAHEKYTHLLDQEQKINEGYQILDGIFANGRVNSEQTQKLLDFSNKLEDGLESIARSQTEIDSKIEKFYSTFSSSLFLTKSQAAEERGDVIMENSNKNVNTEDSIHSKETLKEENLQIKIEEEHKTPKQHSVESEKKPYTHKKTDQQEKRDEKLNGQSEITSINCTQIYRQAKSEEMEIEKKPSSKENPPLTLHTNSVVSSSMQKDTLYGVAEEVNSNTEPLPTLKNKLEKKLPGNTVSLRAAAIDAFRKYVPTLMKNIMWKGQRKYFIRADSLDQFLKSSKSFSTLPEPLPENWTQLVSFVEQESVKFTNCCMKIMTSFESIQSVVQQVLNTPIKSSIQNEMELLLHSISRINSKEMENWRVILKNSIIFPLDPQLAIKFNCLLWTDRLLATFLNKRVAAQQDDSHREQTRKIIQEFNEEVKKLTHSKYPLLLQRNIWGILVTVGISTGIRASKIWQKLCILGGKLIEKSSLSNSELRVTDVVANLFKMRSFVVNYFNDLVNKKPQSIVVFLGALRKKKKLNLVMNIRFDKHAMQIMKNFRKTIAAFTQEQRTQGSNLSKLLKQINKLPFKVLEIQRVMGDKIRSLQAANSVINELEKASKNFDKMTWISLSQRCESILQSQHAYLLETSMRSKMELIVKISKSSAVTGELQANTNYKEILETKEMISQLKKLNHPRSIHLKLFDPDIWAVSVRLIKAVWENKIVRLDPLITPADLKKLEKEGDLYKGQSENDERNLQQIRDFLSFLNDQVTARVRVINSIRRPTEWMAFNTVFEGIVDFEYELTQKKNELLKQKV